MYVTQNTEPITPILPQLPPDAHRIHVMGAPGAGTTTLGRLLAQQRGIPHFDSDDYHWFTSDPEPYRRRRNPDHRRALLSADLDAHPAWVLSGSLCGWGDVFVPRFDCIVFCTAPTDVRLERIRARELARYGLERLEAGGDLHGVFVKFLDWAAAYETDSERMRSLAFERAWVGEHFLGSVVFFNT
jgi:adenylate kinase family enzyme